MMEDRILRQGLTVQAESSGMQWKTEELLGDGGQGQVYRATSGKNAVALKWYKQWAATPQQRAALAELVRKGPPTEHFLWPLGLVTARGLPSFGYIMPLRPPRFRSITDLMFRRIEPTWRALTTAGFNLAHSYLQLHSRGFCYCDISFGNVSFDPGTGEVLICDNDNVRVNGSKDIAIFGTPKFMAPEIVRGEATPNTSTDLFSLATLLFYLLILHHPLEGKKEAAIPDINDPVAARRLYGTEPLFVFDPVDRSNAPVPDVHPNALVFWPIYPQFMRDLFTSAFTKGIRDPENGRVRESEWRSAMVRLRDAIMYCQSCGAENFYDASALASSATGPKCWACGKPVKLPPRMRFANNAIVALNRDTKLYPHHLDDGKPYDFSRPLAEVARHPKDPQTWGLKNLCAEKWVFTTPDGMTNDVPPGRSVTLATGTKIYFGKAQGEIRV